MKVHIRRRKVVSVSRVKLDVNCELFELGEVAS